MKEKVKVNEVVSNEMLMNILMEESLNHWEARQIVGMIGSFPLDKLLRLRKALKRITKMVNPEEEKPFDIVEAQLNAWKHGELSE